MTMIRTGILVIAIVATNVGAPLVACAGARAQDEVPHGAYRVGVDWNACGGAENRPPDTRLGERGVTYHGPNGEIVYVVAARFRTAIYATRGLERVRAQAAETSGVAPRYYGQTLDHVDCEFLVLGSQAKDETLSSEVNWSEYRHVMVFARDEEVTIVAARNASALRAFCDTYYPVEAPN
jgi:hypothetical protein